MNMSDQNNMEIQPVNSVQEYLAILEEVLEKQEKKTQNEKFTKFFPEQLFNRSWTKPSSNYLFRGLPNAKWHVQSTASLRSINKNTEQTSGNSHNLIDPEDLEIYDESLVQYFKHESFKDDRDSDIMDTDLGILAQLRHYNAATSLIDFTSNSLVALWFACQPATRKDNNNKYIETEGKVSIIQTNNDFIEISSIKQLGDYTVEEIYKEENKLFYWKPSHLNKRIPAQRSYFVFGKHNVESSIIYRIIISNDAKGKILKNLSMYYGINELSLFPDMSGFAQANSKDSPHSMNKLYEIKVKDHARNIQNLKHENKTTELSLEYYRLGEVNIKLGYLAKAQSNFTEAIGSDVSNYKAYHSRGVIYYKLSQMKKNFIPQASQNIDQYLNQAIADFKKAVDINNDHGPALNNIAGIKLELGKKHKQNKRFQEAITYYIKANKINPNSSHVYIGWGMAENLLGNYIKSIEKYNEAIKIDPYNWTAYYQRGLSKALLAKQVKEGEQCIEYLKSAILDFEKIIDLHPSNYVGYYECSLTCIELEQKINNEERKIYLNKAAKYSKVAHDRRPYDSHTLINAASCYYHLACLSEDSDEAANLYTDAIKLYEDAIKLDPKDYQTYHSIGSSKVALERFEEALTDYKKALELEPDSHIINHYIGKANYNLYKRHDPEAYRLEALKELKYFMHNSKTETENPIIKQARDEATQIIMELDAAGKSDQ